jgi:hypothetical protein
VLVPLTDHVALVSLTRDIPMRFVLQTAAAVQKQITRDFEPFWGLPATVDVFEDLGSVPSDYHPVIVFGDADEVAAELSPLVGDRVAAELIDEFEQQKMSGLHLNAYTRQPFALVAASDAWSVTVSHEILELIADPYGNRLIAATHPQRHNQRVKYLLEVCDPCQTVWYPVNGVPVSDFYAPRYFDPVEAPQGRYSFTGEIEKPLQILEGGYLTWIDPEDSALYQLGAEDDEPVLVHSLAQLAASTAPLRTIVDTNERTPQISGAALRQARTVTAGAGVVDAVREASDGAGLRTAQAVFSLAAGRG